MTRTILITGAASGLGEAFLKAFAVEPDNHIIALDRAQLFTNGLPNVQNYMADVASLSSLNQFCEQIRNISIDLVIHSAGIRGLVPGVERVKPNDVAACETLDVMNEETLSQAFQTNTVGTFMLLRGILPSLRKGSKPKVVVMSSRMGSVGNNEHPRKDAGSAYAYRASKAAMNTIVRSFAADVPEVTFVLCHPGRVETKLVKCKEQGAITAEESIQSILPLIDSWSQKDSGRFYDRFGESIEW